MYVCAIVRVEITKNEEIEGVEGSLGVCELVLKAYRKMFNLI